MIVVLGHTVGDDRLAVTLDEMLIRMTVAVGMYVFIGNSGILSFGHIGFMCIGAYAVAWATCEPGWKEIMLRGLPGFLRHEQYPFLLAIGGAGLLAAVIAVPVGVAVARLSGIAASIATFAFLAIVNNIYSNWDSVTGATSSIIGIPTISNPWVYLCFALASVAAAAGFQYSRCGLMLRASRDDEAAAKASGVDIRRARLVAFLLSAFLVGIGGGLYAHFLGVLTVSVFYMDLTFVILSMLIVGGMGSLSGVVVGVVVVTVIVEVLRALERGVDLVGYLIQLPKGFQEISLGVILALILIFRPAGLTGGREISLPTNGRAPLPIRRVRISYDDAGNISEKRPWLPL
jgi:branched-chain amino acid transport system permease protein